MAYRMIVNKYGDSKEALIEQHLYIANCCRDLLQAMRQATPHGRDYQTIADPEVYNQDRELHAQDMGRIERVQARALDTAEDLNRQ